MPYVVVKLRYIKQTTFKKKKMRVGKRWMM